MSIARPVGTDLAGLGAAIRHALPGSLQALRDLRAESLCPGVGARAAIRDSGMRGFEARLAPTNRIERLAMGLLRCRGCGEVVSSLVAKCPTCGQPIGPAVRNRSTLSRWRAWLAGLHELVQSHLADQPPPRRR